MKYTIDTSKYNKEPNDISGSVVGKNSTITTFHCDTDGSETGTYYTPSNRRYLLTVHSAKRMLWSLQWPTGFIFGIGDAFVNEHYKEYLSDFPPEVIQLLKKWFEHFNFMSDSPLLFGINNTTRLFTFKDGLFYLCFPDKSYEIISTLYDNPGISDDVLDKHEGIMGNKLGKWLKAQFAFFATVDERWRNFYKSLNKTTSNDEE